MKRQIKKSPIALAILSFLIEEPMHPYRMQQIIKQRGKDEVINIRHRASIYQTIDRLCRDGAITVKGKERNEGKPDLTVYEITDIGRETVYNWLKEMLSTPKQEFLEFPAAISFLALLKPTDVIEQLSKRVCALEEILSRIEQQFDHANKIGLPRLFLLETEYQRTTTLAELEWVRSVIKDMETKKLDWNREWLKVIKNRLSQ
jgi:DNA-binding PadR family transcriptional regulator